MALFQRQVQLDNAHLPQEQARSVWQCESVIRRPGLDDGLLYYYILVNDLRCLPSTAFTRIIHDSNIDSQYQAKRLMASRRQ